MNYFKAPIPEKAFFQLLGQNFECSIQEARFSGCGHMAGHQDFLQHHPIFNNRHFLMYSKLT
jgi:hypothetical protein